MNTERHGKTSFRQPRTGARVAFILAELLMALAVGALVLAAIATVFGGTASAVRVNQANLLGLRSARVALDLITTQLRKADSCKLVGLVSGSGDAVFPYQASEICIIFGDAEARSDCNPDDYLEMHVKTVNLGAGKTALRLWMNSGARKWNGVTYSGTATSGFVDVPNVVSSTMLYDGNTDLARSVQLQIIIETTEQPGRTARTTLTTSSTLRRG